MNANRFFRSALFPLVIVAAILWIALSTIGDNNKGDKIRFSDVLTLVRENPEGIQSVTFRPSSQEVELRLTSGKRSKTAYPVDESAYELQQLLEEKEVPFDAKRVGSSPWWSVLTSLLPFVLLFGFWIFLMRSVQRKPVTEEESPGTVFHR